jgi:hypothetical protein
VYGGHNGGLFLVAAVTPWFLPIGSSNRRATSAAEPE